MMREPKHYEQRIKECVTKYGNATTSQTKEEAEVSEDDD